MAVGAAAIEAAVAVLEAEAAALAAEELDANDH
jgi:hypothetical protein